MQTRPFLWIAGTFLIVVLGCGEPYTLPDSFKKKSPSKAAAGEPGSEHGGRVSASRARSPGDSFQCQVPEGWEVLHKGPMVGHETEYDLVMGDGARRFMISVIVSPMPESPLAPNGLTLEEIKPLWEIRHLKGATTKTSPERTQLSGRDAYKYAVTKAFPGPDKTAVAVQVVAIFTVAEGRVFTVSFMKPGSNVLDEPEVSKFLDSFRIVSD